MQETVRVQFIIFLRHHYCDSFKQVWGGNGACERLGHPEN